MTVNVEIAKAEYSSEINLEDKFEILIKDYKKM
jgi:hypothetical protein